MSLAATATAAGLITLESSGAERSAEPLISIEALTGGFVLEEYGSRVASLSAEQADSLNHVGGGRYLSVEPAGPAGMWRVSAHNYVGSISVAGVQVLVQPKIPLRNLFLLLEVGLRPQDWHDEAVSYETSRDLLPALISFFARTTETTLARGLYHSYREHHDRLIALRGRVDIPRQLTRPGMAIPTACRYTDFTADLIENSYLKAAVWRSLRVPSVRPDDRRRLMQHLVALEDVGDTPHASTDYDRVAFTRLNDHYKPALRLARLVLANLTLRDDIGDTSASSFMVDMNELFERFVTERLRNALRSRLTLKSQHSDHLDYGDNVAICPDLLFVRDGAPILVADIKYKLTDDTAAGRSADYYQLLAYTTALNLPGGVLIYCLDANRPGGMPTGGPAAASHADDARASYRAVSDTTPAPNRASSDTTPIPQALGADNSPGFGTAEALRSDGTARVRSVRVKHVNKVLHTYALDLSGTAEDVNINIRELADWIADRA